MAKKKKGIIYYIGQFFGLIFKGIKWIFSSIWKIIKWVYSLIKKEEEKQVQKVKDKKRPKIEARYKGFLELENLEGDLEEFESRIYSNKSLIGLILGARGSGKSAIGMKILENIKAKTDKRIYVMGFNEEDLPKWIEPISSIDEIKTNSFILVDEGGIEFSSRSSMSNPNKLLSELLLIARHKDLSVLFITQNSSNIEVNTIRQTDYLLLKKPSLLQLDFERKKIKDIYKSVNKEFKKYKKEKGIAYIYSDNYRGFISNDLPSFWNKKISKSFEHHHVQKLEK